MVQRGWLWAGSIGGGLAGAAALLSYFGMTLISSLLREGFSGTNIGGIVLAALLPTFLGGVIGGCGGLVITIFTGPFVRKFVSAQPAEPIISPADGDIWQAAGEYVLIAVLAGLAFFAILYI